MATITRAEIDKYLDVRDAISADIKAKLVADLVAIDFGDIALARSEIIALMDAYLRSGTAAASKVSSGFYDLVREKSIGKALGAGAMDLYQPQATEAFIRAGIQYVVDTGNPEPFLEEVLGRVDYDINRVSGETILYHGISDPARTYFARVPAPGSKCKFCGMLASRGFVYLNAKSAGEGNHYHANCRCQIVPGFDTMTDGFSRRQSMSTQIEGYDPDELYEQYLDDIKSGKLNATALRAAADRAKARHR